MTDADSASATAPADRGVHRRLPLVLAGYLDWRRQFDDWLAVTTIRLDTAQRLGDGHGESMRPGTGGGAGRGAHRARRCRRRVRAGAGDLVAAGEEGRTVLLYRYDVPSTSSDFSPISGAAEVIESIERAGWHLSGMAYDGKQARNGAVVLLFRRS